jgi:hypothetical protein
MLFVMDNEKRMTKWCRMWNEDPSLAHDLMSDDCVQWSDRGAGLETVIGPEEQERFVAGYRAQHVNVFSPRLFVDAGNRFGYLWDVRKLDGQVLTGIDVNILKDGRIGENWTFVAERRCERPDPGWEATGRTNPRHDGGPVPLLGAASQRPRRVGPGCRHGRLSPVLGGRLGR